MDVKPLLVKAPNGKVVKVFFKKTVLQEDIDTLDPKSETFVIMDIKGGRPEIQAEVMRDSFIDENDEEKLAIEMAEADIKAGKPNAAKLKENVERIVQGRKAKPSRWS